ncbi:MAG: hypothetical protein KatS3mg002_1050 [Candidatus Woesearchaeota archaeon]|jgi:hypothetical protein|nr:MAG: hypothetical protein KatS3mg002_1050 [Candidatus Woesearchaeota archaeon]
MNILDKIYKKENDIFGYPQIYKEIKFYPLKISDIEMIDVFYGVFQYPKNIISDKEVLKMSYLKYLLLVIRYGIRDSIESDLKKLLCHILKTKKVSFDYIQDENKNLSINIKINDIELSEYDFDIMREIILLQNGLSVEYIESFNPELEKILVEANKKYEDITLEDEIFTLVCLTKLSIEEISKLTLYQFKKLLQRAMLVFEYNQIKPLEISGQIKSESGKEIIKHYLSNIKLSGRYENILIPKDSFVSEQKDLFNFNKE